MPYHSQGQPVHDPKILRAIAHPVRNRILTELTASGSMRAADLARELDIPANQASFHLRQLAKYGLVEEDPEAARDKRDRVWRPTSEHGLTVKLDELEQQPGGKAASAVFRRNAAGWGHAVVDAAYADRERDPDTLRTVNESAIRLTQEEAGQLAEELDAVARGVDEAHPGPRRRASYLPVVLGPAALPGDARARGRLMAARLRPARPGRGRRRPGPGRRRRRRPRRPPAAHQALPRRPRGPRARPLGGGPGPAVRRGAGDPRRPAHPRHPAGGRRDGRRHLDRPGRRVARPGPTPRPPAGSARAASAPT